MAKAFFMSMLALLGLSLWLTLPHALKKDCPVCLGEGLLPVKAGVFVAERGGKWREKKTMLCPFCKEGRISHYDLEEKRELMMRWMVREQKLAAPELLRRVERGWDQEGLDLLHDKKFFLGSD